jgi:hypothetical protein
MVTHHSSAAALWQIFIFSTAINFFAFSMAASSSRSFVNGAPSGDFPTAFLDTMTLLAPACFGESLGGFELPPCCGFARAPERIEGLMRLSSPVF